MYVKQTKNPFCIISHTALSSSTIHETFISLSSPSSDFDVPSSQASLHTTKTTTTAVCNPYVLVLLTTTTHYSKTYQQICWSRKDWWDSQYSVVSARFFHSSSNALDEEISGRRLT